LADVYLKFTGIFWKMTKRKEDKINLPDGAKVQYLLDTLQKELSLPTSGFQSTENLVILVNGMNINGLEGFDTTLKDGDVVAFLFPVGGG